MKFRRTQARDDRGAVALEFALVLVPLLLIVGGIVDFGFVFAEKNALNQSVREGARISVVQPDPSNPADIDELVKTAAADTFIGDDPLTGAPSIVVTGEQCDDPGVGYGDSITVTATFETEPPMLLVHALTGVLGPTTLTSQATFRCEW